MKFRVSFKFLFCSMLVLLLSACNRKYQALPSLNDLPLMKMENQARSNIFIEGSINRANLTRFVNEAIDDFLKKQSAIKVEGFDVSLSRYDEVNVGLTGKTITSKLPFNLTISKDIVIGKITAKGAIQLFLSSEINIDDYWNLETKTKVLEYEWLEPLKLISGFGISLESMADNVLSSSIEKITTEIDRQIKANVSLPDLIRANIKHIEGPFVLPGVTNEQLSIAWSGFTVEPISNSLGNIDFSIGADASLALDNRLEKSSMHPIPAMKWHTSNEIKHTLVCLPLSMSVDSLNLLVSKELVGKELKQADRTIKIEQVDIAESASILSLKALLSGDYDGTLDVKCRPIYNAEANKFLLNELDLQFKSPNKLKQIGLNLFKGRIKREIEESVLLELENIRQMIKPSIDQELDRLLQQNGIKIKLDLDKIQLANFDIKNQAVNALILVEGGLKVHIDDLSKLLSPPSKSKAN